MLLTPRTTTATEAAKAIRRCVEVGAVSLLAYALDAMADEGVDEVEVEAILERGVPSPDRNHPDRWSVRCAGTVCVIVELATDPWTVVVTVFYPER